MKPPTIESVLQTLHAHHPDADLDFVRLAYEFANDAHAGQMRKSGDPYITHPVAAAQHLAMLKQRETIIAAALLHDVLEDGNIPYPELEKNFGNDITSLVARVTKLGKIKYRGIERYMENLRRMFIAFAEDNRVILIKFADRMHNLETLNFLRPDKRKRIALESLEIYAPIANRLGMGELKGRLEDLSFPHVYSKEYEWVQKIASELLVKRKNYVEQLIERVRAQLRTNNIQVLSVHGRSKHLYSLYKKLLRYDNDITKIYDLVALRIIVPQVQDCYAVLGLIHAEWTPLKDRVKDYIARPKPNGYQSLHTTVFCDHGQVVEFQIRTPEMHEAAEYGIVAHWAYDETGKPTEGSKVPKQQLQWLDQLIKIQKEASSESEALETIKFDLFQNRIFVFTPTGDVIDLPEDATPIDFAYHIHTGLGDACAAAKVNDHLQSLDTKLQNGDVVEILPDKKRKHPNPDWLDFVKTSSARKHIASHLRKHKRIRFHFPAPMF